MQIIQTVEEISHVTSEDTQDFVIPILTDLKKHRSTVCTLELILNEDHMK